MESIIKGVGNTKDLLVLKLEKIRLQSEQKSSKLFDNQDLSNEKIDDIHRQIQDSILENQKYQQVTSHFAKANGDDTAED